MHTIQLKLETWHSMVKGKMKLCVVLLLYSFCACTSDADKYDASGIFEATEIVVSSEATGRLLQFVIEEGKELAQGTSIGFIDTVQLYTQKAQVESSISGIRARIPDIEAQLASLQSQRDNAIIDRQRIQNLYKDSVATKKQLDDITTQVKSLEQQIEAQKKTLLQNTEGMYQDIKRLDMQLLQINDLLSKSYIVNPINGIVLLKYKEPFEFVAQGMPLYKIADISSLFLRVFITAEQLQEVKIGQVVTVHVDEGKNSSKYFEGVVTWIANKAEFTPKNIQVKGQRSNLVYALKIAVKNDGFIKIGQYGDVKFATK